MSGVSPIQGMSSAETWEAWQALVQASLAETEAALPQLHGDLQADHAQLHAGLHADLQTQPAAAAALEARAVAEAPLQTTPTALPPASASRETGQAGPHAAAQPPSGSFLGDMTASGARLAEANAAVLPMAPVLLTPLALQGGPELRWRVQDAPAWRALFDDAGVAGDEAGPDDDDAGDAPPMPAPQALPADEVPAWAQTLLHRLRMAATAPASATALRPALQAWRLGLPVLLASPAGLACLQPSRDASTWQWRRWPARWRGARPAQGERWWAVRVGLSPQGRPRTLRELAGGAALPPGQVSCELRLDDVAPGLAHWTEVLVQAPASPSLRALLGARPSLTWLLCNQALWPQES